LEFFCASLRVDDFVDRVEGCECCLGGELALNFAMTCTIL
jgi:hypothetical protein